jgi:hypothetical protein
MNTLANSDDEECSDRASDASEEDESDSDTDASHIEGVRKLSEIRFPSSVDGLVAPGIQCSRDKEAKILSMKQAERYKHTKGLNSVKSTSNYYVYRLRNITNDDPLRTPQKGNGPSYSNSNQQSDNDRARTPQKSIKRSRPEEVSKLAED